MLRLALIKVHLQSVTECI